MKMYFQARALKLSTLALSFLALAGCGKSNDTGKAKAVKKLENPVAIAKVEKFCGDCHPMPSPTSFPRSQWIAEIEQGYQFYRDSNRTDLSEPTFGDTARYFQYEAPETVSVPSATEIKNFPTAVSFIPSAMLASSDFTSMTSHVVWEPERKSVLFADMTTGKVKRWKPDATFAKLPKTDVIKLGDDTVVIEGKNSCRIHPTDWNNDGITDYVLGEIGATNISDQKQGNVSILIQDQDGKFQRKILVENLARSFEGVPFDYDEDGDIDILIAEFGRHVAGVFSLLRNEGASITDPQPDQFKYEVLDPRHGLLGIVVADVNGDGKQDLVTAFGQEYETVEVFYNQGAGKYERVEVVRFPDPSYNSSSIRVVDIDQDGKLDVIHTCGDIFDSFVPKSFHGVRLIQQTELGRWEIKELGMLIGAMHSAIADYDQDGDLDIAAVGLFPNDYESGTSFDSVVWWEQKGKEFLRHSIERDHCYHAACEAVDANEDGRVDLIVGEWRADGVAGSLRVFWNQPNSK